MMKHWQIYAASNPLTHTPTPFKKRTFLIFIAEVLRCQERATMIINWLSAIRWRAGTSHSSWWQTEDRVSGSETYRRGRRQLWQIDVDVTFPHTMTRYSIPQGGKSQSDGKRREEAFLPWRKRLERSQAREGENGNGEVKKKCNSEVTGC